MKCCNWNSRGAALSNPARKLHRLSTGAVSKGSQIWLDSPKTITFDYWVSNQPILALCESYPVSCSRPPTASPKVQGQTYPPPPTTHKWYESPSRLPMEVKWTAYHHHHHPEWVSSTDPPLDSSVLFLGLTTYLGAFQLLLKGAWPFHHGRSETATSQCQTGQDDLLGKQDLIPKHWKWAQPPPPPPPSQIGGPVPISKHWKWAQPPHSQIGGPVPISKHWKWAAPPPPPQYSSVKVMWCCCLSIQKKERVLCSKTVQEPIQKWHAQLSESLTVHSECTFSWVQRQDAKSGQYPVEQ